MASLKVYTRQDKAAFLNHLGKHDIRINSDDIENVQEDGNKKSYFIVHNLDDVTIDKIKDIFSNNPDMDVSVLKEWLRKIVREELSK
jgi:hypothetical protein